LALPARTTLGGPPIDEEIEAPLDDLEALAEEDGELGDGKVSAVGTGGNSAATGITTAAQS